MKKSAKVRQTGRMGYLGCTTKHGQYDALCGSPQHGRNLSAGFAVLSVATNLTSMLLAYPTNRTAVRCNLWNRFARMAEDMMLLLCRQLCCIMPNKGAAV
jgi:hypothetical protein